MQNQQNSYSEKDILTDVLNTEKQLIANYGTYIAEASNPELRQVLSSNLSQTVQDQYQTFDFMSMRGWYPTKPAQQQDIDLACQTLGQVKQQLGN